MIPRGAPAGQERPRAVPRAANPGGGAGATMGAC